MGGCVFKFMTEKTEYLSQESFDKLKTELEDLVKNQIPSIANRIDEARQMGDLSENAEYHAAREDMSWARTREKEIKNILDNAKIIEKTDHSGVIDVGSTIIVDLNGKKKEYKIVGAQEADPLSGMISNESPLGSAFLGKKKKDKVQVEVPAGVQTYKIIDVK